MSDWYDPYNPPAYDDYSDLDMADLGGDGGMFMDPGLGDSGLMPSFPGDLSASGKPQASDLATTNRTFTAMNNFLKMRASPYFNQMVSEFYPEAGAFDYSAFQPGGGVTGTNAGFGIDASNGFGTGMTGLGAGGAGGAGGTGFSSGGGGGPKYDPYYDTTVLDNAMNSEDPVIAGIAKDVSSGTKDTYTMKNKLRQLTGEDGQLLADSDPERLKTYLSAVDDFSKTALGKSRNERIGQATGMGAIGTEPAGPLANYWARSGMPSPAEMYDETNLPADVEAPLQQDLATNPYLHSEQLRDIALANQLKGEYADYNKAPAQFTPPMNFPKYPSSPLTYDELLAQQGGGGGGAPALPGDPNNRNPNVAERAYGAIQHLPTPGQTWNAFNENVGGRLASGAGGLFNFITGKESDQQQQQQQQRTPGGWSAFKPQGAPDQTRNLNKVAQAMYQVARQQSRQRMFNEYTNLQRSGEHQQKYEGDRRRFAAEQVQAQGRTPGKDRLRAQLAMMRQMGIGL